MQLGLEEINTTGGIDGHKIVIIYEDSQSEPKMAVTALQKLITTDHVQVVIGDIASSSVLAMAPIAESNQVVLLSPGASSPDISKAGHFIFRNWQSDLLEGTADAAFAQSKLHWRRVACLYVNNAYGTGLSRVFEETFSSRGGEIVGKEAFPQGATDIKAQITKIASSQPDGIYMPGYPREMATALKQMQELGIKIQVLSVQAFDDPEIIDRADQAAEGVVFSVPKPPNSQDPIVASFRSSYIDKYGKEPGVTSDTGYDAIRIVGMALRQGARTGPQIRVALASMKDFPGAAGTTTFDENGDVEREFMFKIIRGRKSVPVGSP
jgi:branched-chain amino acid transport system substrate-binding protein